MSPVSWTEAAWEETRSLPNLGPIEESWERTTLADYDVIARAGVTVKSRSMHIPFYAFTLLDLATWLHEVGHLRTLAPRHYIHNGTARQTARQEMLAWRWAQVTMGELWTPEVMRMAVLCMKTYRDGFRRRRAHAAFIKELFSWQTPTSLANPGYNPWSPSFAPTSRLRVSPSPSISTLA